MSSKNPKEKKTLEIPLLPLRDTIIFPYTVVPFFVGREKSINALQDAMNDNKEIFLSTQKKAKTNDPAPEDIYEVGTVSTILQLLRLPDGTVKVLVEGKSRAKIIKYTKQDPHFKVLAMVTEDQAGNAIETSAITRTVKETFDQYVKLNRRIPPEMLLSISSIEDPSKLADTILAHLVNLKLEEKQQLLETANVLKRLESIYGYMQSEIQILKIEKKIRARVKKQMEKTQKDYYLNEQMQAIQRELGDRDDLKNEIQEIEEKLKKKKLSKDALEKVKKELSKLKLMSPMSAEATVVRNYIDHVISLPWDETSKDNKDIEKAEKILDEDHYGLEKVKERILEYLAVTALVEELRGPILCLVGPPGVGKTSLAKSIARSTNRSFARIALGGVKDEAEIRGHRRTYIGAMPGKIILALKKAGTSNPVILLDEVDKLASDHRGDPSSALLEVLDPEQNHTFTDHYLDLEYDLSKVLFIATANFLQNIPVALRDRMEVIELSSYTEIEKTNIAAKFLVSKQKEANGLIKHDVTFSNSALVELIRFYTREAGVRNLEREVASIFRKIARTYVKAQGKTKAGNRKKAMQPTHVTPKMINKFLGPRQHDYGRSNQHDEVGVVTGLAWTQMGGDLMNIEITVLPGKGNLKITGKLGEVMQESAQAALSYVRSRASYLGLATDFYQSIDIHVHVPEGAIPKDGPSAGIAMATAITSSLIKIPVSKSVAMTGEITLRGRVLPIGGLKEKMLAAHRGGIKTLIIPAQNEKDLHELPKKILSTFRVVFAEHMDEVLINALMLPNRDEFYKQIQEAHLLYQPGNKMHSSTLIQ